jgi:hypothetical protein
MGSTAAPSIKSHDDSTISGRVFPWDDQLVNAEAYRRVLEHHRSRSEVLGRNGQTRLEVPSRETENDEGYSSRSGTTAESNHSPDHRKYHDLHARNGRSKRINFDHRQCLLFGLVSPGGRLSDHTRMLLRIQTRFTGVEAFTTQLSPSCLNLTCMLTAINPILRGLLGRRRAFGPTCPR